MIVVGLIVGLPLALAGGRAAQALLYELSPYDPFALIASVSLLASIALGAAVIPAVRAARTDLAAALRSD
jgi:putative ABC transport system permease protein